MLYLEGRLLLILMDLLRRPPQFNDAAEMTRLKNWHQSHLYFFEKLKLQIHLYFPPKTFSHRLKLHQST